MIALLAMTLATMLAAPAHASLVLSQVILDLKPGAPVAQDIEVWNNGTERSYVVAEPEEVVSPGLPGEHRTANPDPAVSGLLVTPQRMILEPGQRRLVRMAAVAPRAARDRIYRVAIKPVAGDVSATASALKLLVGYDVLVIYRPDKPVSDVTASRGADGIVFENIGNTNVEMFEGRQCDAAGKICKDLPANRLYPGMRWTVPTAPGATVSYRMTTAGETVSKTF